MRGIKLSPLRKSKCKNKSTRVRAEDRVKGSKKIKSNRGKKQRGSGKEVEKNSLKIGREGSFVNKSNPIFHWA